MNLHGDTERFRLTLEQDPHQIDAFRLLRAAYHQEGRWVDLCRLYEQQAAAFTEPVRALCCLLAAGDLWIQRAHEPLRAIESFRRALTLEPGSRVAFEALEEAYRQAGRLRDLLDLLQSRCRDEEAGPRRGEIALRIARLLEQELKRPDEAAAYYREALQSNPFLREAVREGAIRLLEMRLRLPATLAHLERIFRELGELPPVFELLRRRAEVTEDAQERADVFCDLAALHQERGSASEVVLDAYRSAAAAAPLHPERIVEGIRAILQINPGSRPALGILRRVHGELHRWNAVLDLLEEEVELARGSDAGELLYEMGTVEEERLFRPDRAVARYREAVARAPKLAARVEERLRALGRPGGPAGAGARRALVEVLAEQEAWPDLEGLLQEERRLGATAKERQDATLGVARIRLERLGDATTARDLLIDLLGEDEDREEAARGLEAVLGKLPGDPATVTALGKFYRDHGRFNELVSLLERQLETAPDSRREAALHYELGLILEERLERREAAMAHYQSAFRLEPGERRYIEAGGRIYRQLRRWPMVVRLLDIELGVVLEIDRRLSILLEKASILRRHLRQPVEAFLALCALLEEQPGHEAARREARSLLSVAEDREQVLETLAQMGRDDAQSALVARRLSLISEIFGEEPPDLELALDAARRAQRLDAEAPAIQRQLERILGQLGRWPELVDALCRAAARELDAAKEEELWLAAGRILLDRLHDLPQAAKILQKALELRPENLALRDELRNLLEEAGDLADLAVLHRFCLSSSPDLEDPARRRELLLRWAVLAQEVGKDRQAASEPFRLLLAEEPHHPEALRFFRQHLRDTGQPAELLRLLDQAWASHPEAGSDLLAEAAELAETALGDPEGAIQRWSALLHRQPGDLRALTALERLLGKSQRWEQLLELQLAQAKQLAGSQERAALLRRAVTSVRELGGDPGQAEAVCRELLQVAPEDSGALEVLGELLEVRSRWEELAANLARRASLAREMKTRAELLRRRAALLSRRLGQHDEALRDLEQVLDLFPEDRAALEQSREILGQLGRFDELLRIMESQAALVSSPEARTGLLREMALLAEEQARLPEQAIGLWQRLLASRPGDQEALAALARLHEAREDWPSLVTVLQRQLDVLPDAESRISLLARLGQVYQERLEDHERAQHAWQAVLDLDPEDGQAIARLQALFDARQDWVRLLEVLERRIRLEVDPAEAATLLQRRATILETSLGRPRQAIQALEEARERIASDPATLRPLRRLLLSQGEYRRAVDTIEEELAPNTSTQAVELCLQAAEIWRSQIKEPQGAILWYRRVLQLAPGHGEALQALRTMYRRLADLPALEGVVEAQLAQASAVPERFGLLLELGKIALEKNDPEQAFLRFRQAHQLSPTQPEALTAIRRLAESHGLPERLLEVLQWTMVKSSQPEEKLVLLAEIAEIQEQRLADPVRALATYRLAFSLQPAQAPLLADIERLARQTGQWSVLLEALLLYLRTRRRVAERIDVHVRRAAVMEHELADPAAAAAELRQAFALDPASERVRREIEGLAERSGDWQPLLEVYGELLDRVENLSAQTLLLQRIARVQEVHLGDPTAALEALRQAFLLDPLMEQVESDLNRLGQATASWPLLLQTYEEAIRRTAEPRVRARFLFRLAEIREIPLQDPAGAGASYREAFCVDPRSERAASELQRLAAQTPGGWEHLLELFAETAERSPSGDVEVALRRRCLRIIEEELGQPSLAVPHLLRLWELEEANEDELRRLTLRLREEGAWEKLLQVHGSLLARTSDPARRLGRLFQIAHIQEQSGADPRATLTTLQTILQEAPGNLEALRALARLQQSLGNGEQAIAAMEEEATRLDDPAARAGLGQRVAQLWDRLGRPDRAARRLLQILGEDPEHAGAAADLEALYLREGNWEDLLELLEKLADRSRQREQRLAHLGRMAGIAWERFENRKRAVRCLTRILEEDPGNLPALERMAAYYREERRWGDLLEILERQAANTNDLGALLKLLLEIGEIQKERLFSRKRAVEAFERALVIAPRDDRLLAPLDELYTELEDWPNCARIRRLRSQSALGTPQAGLRLLAQAEVELSHGEDGREAAATLRAALEADPGLRSQLVQWRERFATGKDRQALLVLLGVEEATASQAEEKAALLCEMGRLAEEEKDQARALELYRKALASRPGHLPALAALPALHRAAGEWREVDLYLGRTIRLLSGAAGPREPSLAAGAEEARPRLTDLLLDWARVALLLRERGMAVSRLVRLLELAPDHRTARKLLAELHFEDARWEAAEASLRRLLAAEGGGTTDPEAPTWSYRLGRCLEATDRPAEAADAYREAIRLDPDHPDAPPRLIACLTRLEQWEETGRAMERLLSRTGGVEARYELLVELAQLQAERLGQRQAALARLEEAWRLDPQDPRALRRLLALLAGSQEYPRILLLAADLAGATPDPAEARRLHLLRGRILLEQLRRPDAAAEAFRLVLHSNPHDSEAVELLVRALEQHGEWAEQARILLEHETRLEADGSPVPLAIRLSLATLLAERLGQPEEAARVIERAQRGHPGSAEVWRARAALLATQPQREHELVDALERALELEPNHVPTQHRLLQALLRAGERGRAFVQAELLAFLQLATPDEVRLLEELRPYPAEREDLPLSDWLQSDLLADPPLAGPVTTLLERLLVDAPTLLTGLPARPGAPTGEMLGPGSQHSLFLRLQEVQQLLGLSRRELLLQPGSERTVDPLPGEPPTLLVGDPLLRGLFRREQRFHLGRGLALTVRPCFLARTLSEAEGEQLLAELAGRAWTGAATSLAGCREQLAASLLEGPALLTSLTELAQTIPPGSFARWQQAVEDWACRIGTVLAGDIGVALKALRAETGGDRRRALREMDGLQDLTRRSPRARSLLTWIRGSRYPALLLALAARRTEGAGERPTPLRTRPLPDPPWPGPTTPAPEAQPPEPLADEPAPAKETAPTAESTPGPARTTSSDRAKKPRAPRRKPTKSVPDEVPVSKAEAPASEPRGTRKRAKRATAATGVRDKK